MQVQIFCVSCNRELQEAIYGSAFYPNLITVLLPFLAVTIIVLILAAVSLAGTTRKRARRDETSFVSAALVLGMGLGGFIDGIVLHQILQWHEMLSNKLPPDTLLHKSVNMFWDGIFHACTLMATVIGILLLWRAMRTPGRHSGRVLVGGLLLGWALFNLLEGLIDHHILKLHNVREITASPDLWNYSFDVFSIVLGIVGFIMIRSDVRYAAYE
jgi:uncharacterized membrane protein